MMRIEFFEELPSTQTYLLDQIKNNTLSAPVCIVANRQTAGIGSRGNQWEQVKEALTFSFALQISSLPLDLKLQSACIFFGFIFKEVLSEFGFDVWLKWPNDLYMGESKVGGIIANAYKKDLICGIGLNIFGDKFQSLGASLPKERVLEIFFEKIKNIALWKNVFSKYSLEFYKNFNFSFHYENEVLSLRDAKLLPDGGISLDDRIIYNFR